MLKEILNVVILVIFVCVVVSIFFVLWLFIYNEFIHDDEIVMLEKELNANGERIITKVKCKDYTYKT